MRKSKTARALPDFASEEDELRFWETHDARDFDAGPADDIVLAIKPSPKRRVTLWLDEAVVQTLKVIAGRHDMGYQTLARGLLRRSVRELVESEGAATGERRTRRRKGTKTR